MSNDFSAINYLISSVLLVTDCILIKAQFSDFLVAIVRVILDSRFFHFVYRTIFIISSMINVYSYTPSYAIDTFLFYFITFSCFVCTRTLSTDWGFTIVFIRAFSCHMTNFLTVVAYDNMIRIIHSINL